MQVIASPTLLAAQSIKSYEMVSLFSLFFRRSLPRKPHPHFVVRRLSCQHSAVLPMRRSLARDKAQHGIMAQVMVVVQILVAKRDSMNALGNKRFDRVLDAVLPAAIPETSRNPPGQADTAIGLAQQQHARVRRDGAAVESRFEFRLPRLAKSKESGLHSVSIGGLLCSSRSLCCRRTFADSESPDAPISREISGLRPSLDLGLFKRKVSCRGLNCRAEAVPS